uniref:Reverse transcriptase domain-containing protein n=1 Tax=Cyprinus carpio TaxID=7962 RepID=A0A8C2C292_CYPCA
VIIDHDILIDRLQNYTGIQGQAYMSDRYHFVYLNGESSHLSPVEYGVPQGSVLGPLLFSIYMLPLGNIIRKYGISFHCYADDTQLYISTRPDETSKLSKLTECVKNVKDWMTNNFLLLNSDKTEILLIGPKNITQNLVDYNWLYFPQNNLYNLSLWHLSPWATGVFVFPHPARSGPL